MATTVLLLDGHASALSAEAEAWSAAHLPAGASLLVAGVPAAVSGELVGALGLVAP